MLSRQMPERVQLDVEDIDYALRALRKKRADALEAGEHAGYWHGAHDALESIAHCRLDTQAELVELLAQKLENATIDNYHNESKEQDNA